MRAAAYFKLTAAETLGQTSRLSQKHRDANLQYISEFQHRMRLMKLIYPVIAPGRHTA